MLQALLEMLIGLVALIAAAALSQFGVDLNLPQSDSREVQRVTDCGDKAQPAAAIAVASQPKEC
ncbi:MULTISPECIES: hypothetical protein [Brevundimonas]|uniref:hypothetical protein n=1 Tax=Brevundimonas TaxID=41275 RepID=UPI000F03A125|nr:hypothetical protein [Brevundimonas lutea]